MIIDVKEALRAFPPWAVDNKFEVNDILLAGRVCQDSIDIIHWSDKHRKARRSTVQDRTQVHDNICALEYNSRLRKDKFLSMTESPDFTTEDMALLPTREAVRICVEGV